LLQGWRDFKRADFCFQVVVCFNALRLIAAQFCQDQTRLEEQVADALEVQAIQVRGMTL
jgi:hypothetical protein